MYLSDWRLRWPRGDDRVRIRSASEECHSKDLARSAEGERDRRDLEPRAPDCGGNRIPGPGRGGPPDAPFRGRGHVLEIRHVPLGVETRERRQPRMEGDRRSVW